MRYGLLILTLFLIQTAHSTESIPAYQASLQQMQEKSKATKSPFSAEDMAIMQKASESLASHLPKPGIQLGEKAPDFVLKNAYGEDVNLKNELKKGPVILVFYRGAWCPFCNMHLHVLHKSLPEFQKYNAQLIAVTPQTPDKSAEQIKKDGYPFQVLSDTQSKVMKAYNLYYELEDELVAVYKKHGLDVEAYNGQGRNVLPVSASFVIDQKGIVRALHAVTDYKQRMEPVDIIEALLSIAANNKK